MLTRNLNSITLNSLFYFNSQSTITVYSAFLQCKSVIKIQCQCQYQNANTLNNEWNITHGACAHMAAVRRLTSPYSSLHTWQRVSNVYTLPICDMCVAACSRQWDRKAATRTCQLLAVVWDRWTYCKVTPPPTSRRPRRRGRDVTASCRPRWCRPSSASSSSPTTWNSKKMKTRCASAITFCQWSGTVHSAVVTASIRRPFDCCVLVKDH